jgi:hypothetical protein
MGLWIKKNGLWGAYLDTKEVRVDECPIIHRSKHGARLTQFVTEMLVEIEDTGGGVCTIEDAIPAGAFDVRIGTLILVDLLGEAEAVPTNWSMGFVWGDGGVQDAAFFVANKVGALAGSTSGPQDQYQEQFVPGSFAFPVGADLTISLADGVDALAVESGRIRLAIFYSLITPPTS